MIEAVIKIQSRFRCVLARLRIYTLKKRRYNEKVNEQLWTYSSTILNFNSKKLPAFNFGFDDLDDDTVNHLKEFRGTTSLEKGAVYFGEWIQAVRYGKGIITWKDGSKYEGYFKENQFNGRGRLVHANGEVYEGYWKVIYQLK